VNSQPKLIVTCRTGHLELCMHEIGNVLYAKDPEIKIVESGFPDVLLVYTSLDVAKAYAIVSHREYGFVENIIPIHCVLSSPPRLDEVKECIASLKPPDRVKLKVKARGIREVSKLIFTEIARFLRENNIHHDTTAKTCLYIEVFPNKTYIGLGSCQPVFKAVV